MLGLSLWSDLFFPIVLEKIPPPVHENQLTMAEVTVRLKKEADRSRDVQCAVYEEQKCVLGGSKTGRFHSHTPRLKEGVSMLS